MQLVRFCISGRRQSLLTEELCVLEQVLVQVLLQFLVLELEMCHALQALVLSGTALVAKIWHGVRCWCLGAAACAIQLCFRRVHACA
jgi:hypothetical protein